MKERGFVLFEAMLAVAIFAIGVIALGQCVNHCMSAERLKYEDVLAGQALENRMAEIEGGAVLLSASSVESLKSPFDGMKLKESSAPLKLKNEKGQDLPGLFSVTLVVTWISGGDPREKSLAFYVFQNQT